MKFFEIHKYPSRENFPVYGNINRLYIDLASNKFYYWQDGRYFKISTMELDQATRDEVADIITAHTTPVTIRLTELKTQVSDIWDILQNGGGGGATDIPLSDTNNEPDPTKNNLWFAIE